MNAVSAASESRKRTPMVHLHSKEVAEFEEESVVGAGEVAELERVGLGERRAVADEQDGSRNRLVGEQDVVSEIVRHGSGRAAAVHEQRLTAARVAERNLILCQVLSYVPHEDLPRQLVLELEARDVGGREAAAVLGPCKSLVHPPSFDAQRRRGPELGDGHEGHLSPFGRLGKNGRGTIADRRARDHGTIGRVYRERDVGEMVQRMRHRKRRRADGVPGVVRRVEPEMIQAQVDRKSTRLNSSHPSISYAVFCLKKKKKKKQNRK